ncbi:hypothetical protein ZIOFF_040730 [Zingiber officinale]|uniref:Uncharacterized protein n=1 Tax=Zingiber officinale TaxID=94328 RepID=A0A8J5GCW7_ZINOF|nr:hypothetical protein ZIOFF_040730 [Zingiber officinale]
MSSTQLWSPNSTANNKVDDDSKSIADELTERLRISCTFSDILKVNGGIQELQLNSSGMDDYRSYVALHQNLRSVTEKHFDEELSRRL